MVKRIFKLPVVLVLALLVVMLLVTRLMSWGMLHFAGHEFVAAGLAIIGLVIVIISAVYFRLAKTTVNPIDPGKTTELVQTGPYRYSRNPMYVAFLIWLLAGAVYFANVVNLLLLPLFITLANLWYIVPEEKALTQLFAKDYQDYCQQVPRWW